MNSEVFLKKLHRAHEALSQSDGSGTSSVKTLSASFGTKWPYKRTMSAPASMVPRQDTKQGTREAPSCEAPRFLRGLSSYHSSLLPHPPLSLLIAFFRAHTSHRTFVSHCMLLFYSLFFPQSFTAEKEKVYSRQYSAPILKRKSSRFGLGQLLGFTPPPNNSIPGRVACVLPAAVAG